MDLSARRITASLGYRLTRLSERLADETSADTPSTDQAGKPMVSTHADTDAHTGRTRIAELEAEVQALRQRADGLQNILQRVRIRPIVFTSMPKSGTYFVTNTFARGLTIEQRIVSNQYFPHDTIRFFEMKKLADEGGISQDHFEASAINLTHIGRFTDRVLVQVRDPRQAMLSWIHFIEAFRDNPETYLFIYPPLPAGYFDRPLADKIDWAIDQWLPHLVAWTRDWVKAADEGPLKIKITRFEDMVVQGEAFFHDILDFHGIPRERFFMPALPMGEAVHFRKGETDEWRRVFTPAQIAAAGRAIPAALAGRMGWTDATGEG